MFGVPLCWASFPVARPHESAISACPLYILSSRLLGTPGRSAWACTENSGDALREGAGPHVNVASVCSFSPAERPALAPLPRPPTAVLQSVFSFSCSYSCLSPPSMFLTSFWVMPTAKDPHAYLDVRHTAEIFGREATCSSL